MPILEERGCRGKKLGVEWEAYGLTARSGRRLAAALDGFSELLDASELVSRLRAIKSAAEIEYVRKAADLADAALAEAVRLARPGAFEGDILAAMQGAVFKGDGDYPGNEFIIGSGGGAMIGRYQAGRRILDDDDQLAIEFAGVYRHYHSCLFRTLKIGKENPKHRVMYAVARDALLACADALKPGRPIAEVFAAYEREMEAGGYGAASYNACGYALGTTFAPNWMDWPMLYRGNPEPALPGMVFFIHPGARDDGDGLAAVVGETYLVTEGGAERLSNRAIEYLIAP